MLPKQLQSFSYYKNKLPLYLQNSKSFQEHFRIWYDLLAGHSNDNAEVGDSKFNGVLQTEETLLSLLNLFDTKWVGESFVDSYYEYLTSLSESSDTDDKRSDILDKLGALFGIRRQFSISYSYLGQTHNNVQMSLNDKDFLMYIRVQIIKNNFDGSFEQLQEYYQKCGLPIVIVTSKEEQATANAYLISTEIIDISNQTDIQKLFFAKELLVPSMGIQYTLTAIVIDNMLIWDRSVDSTYKGWDYSAWL